MRQKYIDDIDILIKKLEETHPSLYFGVDKNKIDEMIAEFKNSSEPINEYQFYYFVKILLKQINDAHTTCMFKQKKFPLKVRIIDGKVYVIKASTEYNDYLFNEITAINGVPIANIIRELEKTISYSATGHLENQLEFDLLRPTCILSLPIMNNTQDEIITYTLQKDEEVKELRLNRNEEFNYDFFDTRIYWFEYNQDTNTLIIKYKACQEEKDKPMKEFVEEIGVFVDEHDIKDVIVDIRENSGGNSSVIHPLIEYLDSKKFNLITLIDKGVFSSGRWTLINLKHLGSKFVGTEIGTQINCFGYVEGFELPNSKMRVNCSIRYWYYDGERMKGATKEDFAPFVADEKNQQYFMTSHFIPEIYVDNTIEDYEMGYDRMLDVAIEQFKKKGIKNS